MVRAQDQRELARSLIGEELSKRRSLAIAGMSRMFPEVSTLISSFLQTGVVGGSCQNLRPRVGECILNVDHVITAVDKRSITLADVPYPVNIPTDLITPHSSR